MYLRESRGAVHSFSGFGDAAAYNASSDCTMIPAGDPYRAPGNQCTSGGKVYGFDASGNVTGGTPAPGGSGGSGGAIFLGMTQDELLLAGVGVAALILFTGKKKRRG